MQMCIAFTPAEPELYTLNPNAWLILELAPGRSAAELEAAYLRHTVPPQSELLAGRYLREGVDMLTRNGILHLTTSEPSEQPP
jgi:hypothetical protein